VERLQRASPALLALEARVEERQLDVLVRRGSSEQVEALQDVSLRESNETSCPSSR
jgi:hypothetical protein